MCVLMFVQMNGRTSSLCVVWYRLLMEGGEGVISQWKELPTYVVFVRMTAYRLHDYNIIYMVTMSRKGLVRKLSTTQLEVSHPNHIFFSFYHSGLHSGRCWRNQDGFFTSRLVRPHKPDYYYSCV